MIDLTLLGTGGGMPMPNRNLSALCINYLGRKILIDCGEGTQVSMRMVNLGFKTIDTICITHIHGDHIIGLPGLLGTIGNSGRVDPITIIGPEGIKEAVEGLMVVSKYLPYEVKVIEVIENNIINISEDLDIATVKLDHGLPCLGYSLYLKRKPKFDMEKAEANNVPKQLWSKLQKGNVTINFEGKEYNSSMVKGQDRKGIKISYITDTRPIHDIINFIKESDLFICEGTYGSDEDIEKAIKNKHMTFREAGKLAKDANVKELLLTHFSTAMAEPELYIENAKKEFYNAIIGYDRFKTTLKFED